MSGIEAVKATNISTWDTLADGTMLISTSHQLKWFYVTGIRTDGRLVRRRYRHDQMVEIETR